MKINAKKITSVALATLITIGSTSFAASFTDVADDYWGKPFIEKGKELGFISGYEDGTFKPTASISRMQTITLSARLLNLPEAEITKAKQKYEATLLKHKVPEWAIGDMSVALSKGIIDTNILTKLFNDNGAQTLSPREEVTIYVARAMGLQKEVDSLPKDIVMPFKDSDKIDNLAKPYAYILEKKGIVSGDENKNFKPKNAINRAEMSRMITSAYDYMQKENEEKPTPEPSPEVVTISGTIFSTFSTEEADHVVIETSNGEKENYKLQKDSVLRLDGRAVTHKDLINGLKVRAEVIEGKDNQLGFIKTLNAESKVEKIQGTIYNIRDSYTRSLGIEYVENGVTKRKSFNLSEDALIYLDGKTASFSDLKTDDNVNIEIINDKISEVNAVAYIRDIEGVLKGVNVSSRYIEVELKDGTKATYNLHSNADILRNDRAANLSDLRKGDKISLRIKNNVVTRLDAEIIKSTVEGKVKRKIIGYDRSEITILNNETRKEETYVIPSDARVFLDGKLARLDQIELGYLVELSLEGEEIIEINGNTTTINNKYMGTISYVGRTYLEMNLTNDYGEKVEVIISYDTLIQEESGRTISLTDLRKGDGILVTGEIYGSRLDASKIMKFTK